MAQGVDDGSWCDYTAIYGTFTCCRGLYIRACRTQALIFHQRPRHDQPEDFAWPDLFQRTNVWNAGAAATALHGLHYVDNKSLPGHTSSKHQFAGFDCLELDFILRGGGQLLRLLNIAITQVTEL